MSVFCKIMQKSTIMSYKTYIIKLSGRGGQTILAPPPTSMGVAALLAPMESAGAYDTAAGPVMVNWLAN